MPQPQKPKIPPVTEPPEPPYEPPPPPPENEDWEDYANNMGVLDPWAPAKEPPPATAPRPPPVRPAPIPEEEGDLGHSRSQFYGLGSGHDPTLDLKDPFPDARVKPFHNEDIAHYDENGVVGINRDGSLFVAGWGLGDQVIRGRKADRVYELIQEGVPAKRAVEMGYFGVGRSQARGSGSARKGKVPARKKGGVTVAQGNRKGKGR